MAIHTEIDHKGGDGDEYVTGISGKKSAIRGDGSVDLRDTNAEAQLGGRNLFASALGVDQLKTLRNGGTPSGLRAAAQTIESAARQPRVQDSASPKDAAARGRFTDYGTSTAEAILLPDCDAEEDALAVVYENGAALPEITIHEANTGVYTVLADGVPVAVVASSDAAITVADVLLVEREAQGSAQTAS